MALIIQQLAKIPSTSPTDASGLDSSISALKSCISALESSLKSVGQSSGRWEAIAWVCAIAVAVGVAAEIVGIVWEYRDELRAWQRGIILPPERPSPGKLWFEIAATLLVVAGIFGEAGASLEVASINSHLRSITSELRAKSDQLLALVTREAGDAMQSSTGAINKAGLANEGVNAAKLKLAGVSQKAQQINEQLNLALYLMSARRIRDPKSLTNALRQYKGRSVTLTSYIGNEEGWGLCTQLWYIAHGAKMDAVNKCGDAALTPELIVPLTVFGPDIDEDVKIGGLLARQGIGAVSGVKATSLVIFVGAKSPFIFGPTAQTRDVERAAAAAKKRRSPKARR